MAYKSKTQNFIIQSFIINESTSESYDISDNILDVMIQKDFMNKSMPLYVIDLKTTEEIRNIIRDQNVKIQLLINAYEVDDNSNIDEEDNDNPTITENVLSEVIRLYEKPFTTTVAKKEDTDTNGEDKTQSESAPFVYYRISGIPDGIIEKNKTIINQVYSNVMLNDILVNILSENDNDNIYIEDTQDTNIYKSILIPPMTPIQAIQFIDSNYQLYSTTAKLFFDSDKTYLYDIFNIIDSENTFEYKVISSESTGTEDETIRPSYDNETGNIRLTSKYFPSYADSENISGNTLGSDITFYSYDESYNLVLRDQNEDSVKYKKNRYFWNNHQNKKFETAIVNGIKQTMAGAKINIMNINPNYIKPTTNIILSSQYEHQNGEYTISKLVYSFNTNDFKHYKSIITIDIIKK